MAATVLNGKGNVSYTNNTGQNVRLVFNFLKKEGSSDATITVSNSTGDNLIMSLLGDCVIGKNLAFLDTVTNAYNISGIAGQNAFTNHAGGMEGLPTEVAMGAGETFSIVASDGYIHYNIIVIPEAG